MPKAKKVAPKAKPKALKPASKPAKAGKPASKVAKAPEKPGLAKTFVTAFKKAVSGKKEAAPKADKKEAAPKPAKAASPQPVKEAKVKAASASAGKKGKGKKAKKGDALEFEDDLLDTDDDMAAEELPDLAEFDTEEEEVEVETAEEEAAWAQEVKESESDEIFLTDAEGRRYCRVRDCDQASTVEGYCRYHYLLLWKKIQVRRKILQDGKLERYVEELTSRYPDKFLEMIRKDLRTEKDFITVIAELEIDESLVDNDLEDETQSYVDEIRGMSTESGSMSDEEEF